MDSIKIKVGDAENFEKKVFDEVQKKLDDKDFR
jgi:hypothetical protein